ncbi:MAG TPA: hypothetical protein P5235_10480 [Saprospiraceae bacterium]|nr:hypothetical protein [Saprospiraceae bacterium]
MENYTSHVDHQYGTITEKIASDITGTYNQLEVEISKLISEKLSLEDRVLIISNDENWCESILLNLKEQFDFLPFLDLKGEKYLSNNTLARIQNSITVSSINPSSFQDKIKSSFYLQKLDYHYKLLSAELFGTSDYRAIKEDIDILESRGVPNLAHYIVSPQFSYNPEEYHLWVDNLNQLSRLFNPKFENHYVLSALNANFIDSQEFIPKLEEIIVELKSLNNEFDVISGIQFDNLKARLENENKLKVELLEELKLKLAILLSFDNDKNEPKKGFLDKFSLRSDNYKVGNGALNSIVEECKKLIEDHDYFSEIKLEDWNKNYIDNIQKYVDNLEYLIKLEKNENLEYLKNYFKSQTTLNADNNLIKLWVDSFNENLKKINESHILHNKLTVNSFSITKHKEVLVKIIEKLESIRIELIDNPSYLPYIKVLNGMTVEFRTYFKILSQYSTDKWVEIFKLTYFKTLLNHVNLLPSDTLEEYVDKIVDSLRNMESFSDADSKCNYQKKASQALQQLKSKDKKYYKSLMGGNEELRSVDFIASFPELSKDIFPIVIADNINEYYFNNKVDFIIYLGTPQRRESIEHQVFQVSEELNANLSTKWDTSKKLIEMNTLERLNVARLMSMSIMKYSPELSFIQLKNANIISFLPNDWNEDFCRLNEGLGAKLFKPLSRDSEFKMLLECMMVVDRTQYLLLRDGLINLYHDDIKGQLRLIQEIKASGVSMKPVYTDSHKIQQQKFSTVLAQEEDGI